jgi:hypothetical protein
MTTAKNLQHGYIFLIGTLVCLFLICLVIEIQVKGGFHFSTESTNIQATTEPTPIEASDDLRLQILNIYDGFHIKDEKLIISGVTEEESTVSINDEKINIMEDGRFEKSISLNLGENFLKIVSIKDSRTAKIEIKIFRDEIQSIEPTLTEQPVQLPIQNPVQPKPVPTIAPPISQITALKMSCSITNTAPTVNQFVTINCQVKDQNGNAVSGYDGLITVNWKTGVKTYPISSNGFSVPAGNTGVISGNVRVSKDGLSVSSNFNITVH